MSLPSQNQLQFILQSAVLAPSADNQHQLRFEQTENGVNVWSTHGELPPIGGYRRVLSLLSLGALLENLRIAASCHGIHANIDLLPDQSKPILLAKIQWQSSSTEPDPLWEAIPRRHTNRQLFFRGPGLTSPERALFEREVNNQAGCGLVWFDEGRVRQHALKLVRMAEAVRFRNQVLHQDLFSAVRFDVGWEQTSDWGLPPGALGVERPLRPAFAALRHWKIMRIANLLGASYMLGWRAADIPCRFAPHFGAIVTSNFSDLGVLDAGRSFQRLWLTATSRGLALQPMPASAIYALEGAPAEGVPVSLQRQLKESWREMLAEKIPLMLFRMGYAKPPAVTTTRKPLEQYIR